MKLKVSIVIITTSNRDRREMRFYFDSLILDASKIDLNSLMTLNDVGIDVSFLKDLGMLPAGYLLESLRNTTRLLTTSQRSLETSVVTPSSRKLWRESEYRASF